MPATPQTRAAARTTTRAAGRAAAEAMPMQLPAPTPARGRRKARAVPSVPLGSLTQKENRSGVVCRGCGSSRVTRLSLNLTDGTPVEFTSCHQCEHRTWEHSGSEMSVDTVLDRTRRD